MALSCLRFQGEAARPDRLAQVEDDARPAATQLAAADGARTGPSSGSSESVASNCASGRSRINRSGACREKVR